MASQEPISAAQLELARSSAWRQAGDPILTLEAAKDWLAPLGLVLYAPRAQQLGAPAPSLVEATLGATDDAPSPARTETARTLLARLVGEGHAVPLNLLGGPGEQPDFLASAQVFSFVFTLRGDKLWKQPPATSGANKVTPLALSVYEMLAERGPLSAADLASELGRELTESAVARSLNELWQHLRVTPLPQQGEGATLWELTTRRFTKAIKAGANAGQPTALSALVSLYLAQALLASEEETAAFLSPLAPRSRIREVLHALVAARELNELVIDGKTLLNIPGALPEFPAIQAPAASAEGEETAQSAEAAESADSDSRIKRFTPRSEQDSSAYRGKSSAGPGYRSKPAGGGFRKSAGSSDAERRPPRAPRPAGAPSDRERRPFRRDEGASPRPARPSAGSGTRAPRSEYAKPWDEDRKPRPEASGNAGGGESRSPRPPSAGADRPYRAQPSGDRKPFGDRSARQPYGDRKPGGGEDRPRRSSAPISGRPDRAPRGDRQEGDRPFRPRSASASGPRPSRPRTESGAGDRSDRPFRPRTAPGDRGDRPFRPRTGAPSGDRPYRPRPAGDGDERPRRTFGGKSAGGPPSRGAGFSRGPNRGSSAGRPPREGGEGRPPFSREGGAAGRPPRSGSGPSFGRPRSGPPSGDRKPYSRPRPSGDEGAERPPRVYGGDSAGRPPRSGSSSNRPDRPASGDRKPFGDRKPGGFAKRASGGPGRPSFGAGRPAGGSKRPFTKGPAKRTGPGDRPRKPKADE